ncbi:MAG: multicopper oxidase family protein [Cetobacterium sp.]
MNKMFLSLTFIGSFLGASNSLFANTDHLQHHSSQPIIMEAENTENQHSHNTNFSENDLVKDFQKPLLIPPLLKGELKGDERVFNLEVGKGSWEFLDGKFTETYGYNGPILGPVLSLKRGEKTKINIKNNLKEETTVHWHGGILSQDVDGVHNSDIQPNQIKSVNFTLNQPEATLWFHPHPMHKTASQVYKGLAGLIYLEDDESDKINIPKTYGFDDFPIIIQDKQIDNNGQLEYSVTEMDKLHGKSGGYLMINGIISPFVDIPNGVVRLRVVNGSNAANYNINFNGINFLQIASDGGLLNEPVSMENLNLAPGERAEILIDSRNLEKISYMNINGKKALELKKSEKNGLTSIPEKLVNIPKIEENLDNLNTRTFTLKTSSEGNLINDTSYNMETLNFNVQKGEKEIWEIKNSSSTLDMPHPFHVHGAQFRIIERNGKIPPLNEQGWKDTVNLNAGDSVKILITYTTDGITVYHCHILEHEENGMMGQFKIN